MRTISLIALAVLILLSSLDADARRRRRRRRTSSGYLVVKSTTTGARVFVDDRLVGRIPLDQRLRLRAGKHTIKIVKRGFTQYLDVIRVSRRRVATVDIDLLPISGALVVTSPTEKARVFVDGKFVGVTPIDTDVTPGKHALRVKKAGFHDRLATIEIFAGKKETIQAKLEAMAVGTTPYRPPPPPPPKWYEKWYVWAGAAGALAAIAVGIIVPVALSGKDPIKDFGADLGFKVTPQASAP
ncbi:MAG: PEGA domain-containing protein [Deltaproteobacteria bacterium]|nr:PEGA domain-containing protein [Deltaproteobacteria bacterium]